MVAGDRDDRAAVVAVRGRLEQRQQAARRRYVLEQCAAAAGVLRSVLDGRADPGEICDAHVVLGRAVGELMHGSVE